MADRDTNGKARSEDKPRKDSGDPEPVEVPDSERPTVKDPTTARQADPEEGGLIRRIMEISLILLVIAFALIYVYFFV